MCTVFTILSPKGCRWVGGLKKNVRKDFSWPKTVYFKISFWVQINNDLRTIFNHFQPIYIMYSIVKYSLGTILHYYMYHLEVDDYLTGFEGIEGWWMCLQKYFQGKNCKNRTNHWTIPYAHIGNEMQHDTCLDYNVSAFKGPLLNEALLLQYDNFLGGPLVFTDLEMVPALQPEPGTLVKKFSITFKSFIS